MLEHKTYLVGDIETDGLDPSVIWCLCTEDQEGNAKDWLDKEGFQEYMDSFEAIVFHNGINFDIPVLEKLWGINFDNIKVIDTLVVSRLSNPTRDGGHGLKSWGIRLENHKGDYNDWSKLTEEMVEYCRNDVTVTKAVYDLFNAEANGLSLESLDLEHETARIISRQISRGWLLDERKTSLLVAELQGRLDNIVSSVREVFTPLPTFKELNELKVTTKKDGELTSVYQKQLDRGAHYNDEGVWGYTTYPEFNLGSRQQVAKHLQHFGWKPKKFTEKGSVVVNEDTLKDIKDIPEAQLISDYLMVQKRLAQVNSWLKALRADGRVHGYVNPIGAVTGRMTHSKPNLAQVPAGYSPYGKECREVWTVPNGYKLVGMDASGLELRMLAHYMDDKEYTEEVLNGDIHTANQMAAGLESRDSAKTFIYAFLYGAGDEKIGSIIGGGSGEGKRIKKKFLNNTPALRTLRDRVTKAAGRGFLKGLDGRRLEIRSTHAALNTLLQSAGAVVMKKALVLLDDYAKDSGIYYNFIGNIHDEVQTEVREDQAEEFGKLAVKAIVDAGTELNLRCPLDGEYKIGLNWSETH